MRTIAERIAQNRKNRRDARHWASLRRRFERLGIPQSEYRAYLRQHSCNPVAKRLEEDMRAWGLWDLFVVRVESYDRALISEIFKPLRDLIRV